MATKKKLKGKSNQPRLKSKNSKIKISKPPNKLKRKKLNDKIKIKKEAGNAFSFLLKYHHLFSIKCKVYQRINSGDMGQIQADVISDPAAFFNQGYNNQNGESSSPFDTIVRSGIVDTGRGVRITVSSLWKIKAESGKNWQPSDGTSYQDNNNKLHFDFNESGASGVWIRITITIY